MEVTPSGIVTLIKLVQPKNAETPMEVMLFGMVTPIKPVQRKNV